MSKHTPGPFEYEDGWIVKKEEGKDIKRIAEVRGWGWLIHKHVHKDGTSDQGKAAEEQDANGHLLKAAPELLEALEVMLTRVCPRTPHWKDDPDIVKAHAVISKAKGTK